MKKMRYLPILLLLFACDGTDERDSDTSVSPDTDSTATYPGALHYTDQAFTGWAQQYDNYNPGEECEEKWQTPEKSLGEATGETDSIVSLGGGGSITYTFTETPVTNGTGADFAIFGNSFNETFLELAFVEVSSNGTDFVRFPAYSNTADPVSSFGSVTFDDVYDTEKEYTGFAGVHPLGYGTLFDLEDIPAESSLNTDAVTHIRLVDIIGDGSITDTAGNPIYDPYPTTGSAGMDCEAVGIIHFK